jgi:hypothetical protein
MINLTIDDTVLAELLSQIDWREHPKLARLVRSALAKARAPMASAAPPC